jgi:hypothetical protein
MRPTRSSAGGVPITRASSVAQRSQYAPEEPMPDRGHLGRACLSRGARQNVNRSCGRSQGQCALVAVPAHATDGSHVTFDPWA